MNRLISYLTPLVQEGLCVAFSGGVDSSLLLRLACDIGKKEQREVVAVTFETTLHPMNDITIAKEVAKEFGGTHIVLSINELAAVDIANNPVDRCYRCKHYLFQQLKQFAKDRQLKHIIDGTNFDDLSCYRPGLRALQELGIQSPLAALEISKKEVRAMASTLDISVSQRPSAPCLATRIPYNTPLDWDLLKRIDQGEMYLKELGFLTCRIRVHNDVCRIELSKAQFPDFMKEADHIVDTLKCMGFHYITLDLEGFRSGSMDIHLVSEKQEG